jgi:hypothetical protein
LEWEGSWKMETVTFELLGQLDSVMAVVEHMRTMQIGSDAKVVDLVDPCPQNAATSPVRRCWLANTDPAEIDVVETVNVKTIPCLYRLLHIAASFAPLGC